ncbi:hypothetical protein BN927_02201 [Lactococcus lactis subsp. lactis Dephy 1]|nr:hypothetical protein BN927_02201 [Lactococcus lactis subsp. lactis Dephy 1]
MREKKIRTIKLKFKNFIIKFILFASIVPFVMAIMAECSEVAQGQG